jgi:hypothetical protein
MNALNIIDDAGLLTPRRTLGAYLTEIRFEFMRLLRNPALVAPVALVPVALYLLFAVVIWGDAVAKDAGTAIFFFSAFSVFFPLKGSMYAQAQFWPQFHVNQLAMQAAGISKPFFVSTQMSIAALVGFTVLFSAVAIWRLARKG